MVELKNPDEIIGRLVDNLRLFTTQAVHDRAVVAVDGRLPSAVTCAIAARALGKENVLAVVIHDGDNPSEETSIQVAKTLAGQYARIDAEPVTLKALIACAKATSKLERDTKDVSEAARDTSPRLAAALVRNVAQAWNALVFGSLSLSDAYVGNFAKEADDTADLEVVRELTREEIAFLAEHIEEIPECLPEPQAPQAMHFTYRQLHDKLRNGTSGNDDVDYEIRHRHYLSRHKRETPPALAAL